MVSRLIDPSTNQPFTNGTSNGMPSVGGFSGMGYGDDFPLPHVLTYNQILSGGDETYWHERWDEALRHARASALTMRRDAFLMGLLQERKLAVASQPWELEIPDEKDPTQKLVRDTLKRAVENISDFGRIVYALLEAVWYGRYAVELVWDWIKIQGKKVLTVVDWIPINGDKLGWNFDGVPYILVNTGVVTERQDVKIVHTTAGGNGLLLSGTWRDHFVIHRHEMDDGDYFDGEAAAGMWGVGVRSRIFWLDWIRRNQLEWITTFMERVGLGVTLWYYEGGNPAALSAVQDAALKQSRRANLFVPVFTDGKGAPKGLVERIETPVNGVDALRMLNEVIRQDIERFIVGQEASSKSSGSKGLGNEAGAEFQQETKQYIAGFDAKNLSETLTGNARNPGLIYLMQKYSFPETMPDKPGGFRVKLRFGIEKQDTDKKLQAIEKVVSFGIPVKADDARAAAGLSKPDIGDEVIEMGGGAPGEPGAPGAGGDPNDPNAQEPQGAPGSLSGEGDFTPPNPGQEMEKVLGPDAEQALSYAKDNQRDHLLWLAKAFRLVESER